MIGREFLDVADELLRGGTEPHWRTAAGRAYYGLLLEAASALEHWGFVPAPHDSLHRFVRLRFLRVADPDCQRIAQALEDLGKLRNRADYERSRVPSFASSTAAVQAVRRARNNVARLDQVNADPVRLASVVAAIRAQPP